MAGCSLRVTCFIAQPAAGPEETEPIETELLGSSIACRAGCTSTSPVLARAGSGSASAEVKSLALCVVVLVACGKGRTPTCCIFEFLRRRCGGSRSNGFTQRNEESNGLRDYGWAEAFVNIARMILTIKLDGTCGSFQQANNTPPLSVTGRVIAPFRKDEEHATMVAPAKIIYLLRRLHAHSFS